MHLDKDNLPALTTYLQTVGLIGPTDSVSAAGKPGEGNMNYALRLTVGERTFIIKQARPYVEKYPQIPAPSQRALAEAGFYEQIKKSQSLCKLMPELLATDAQSFILVMEDLGNARDGSFLYNTDEVLSENDVEDLCRFLTGIHSKFKKEQEDELMANRALRRLNHEHIFVYPLQEENGFNLDSIQPGLQELSLPFKRNESLKQKAGELGKRYLADGDTLLHGDYYPGSWLFTDEGIKIIDPEFCFYGTPEFDVAVMKAHLMMAGQPEHFRTGLFEYYNKPEGFDDDLFDAFTGMEIIRRIIGLAQLPLSLTLSQKQQLLQQAAILLKENITT